MFDVVASFNEQDTLHAFSSHSRKLEAFQLKNDGIAKIVSFLFYKWLARSYFNQKL